MKVRNRIIMLLFTAMMLFMNVENAYACNLINTREGNINPMYVTLSDAFANLSISDGKAICTAVVKAQKKEKLSITMYLQKKSGTTWTNVKTWEKTAEDAINLSLTKNYTVSKGTYRVRAIMKAGSETVTKTSTSCTKK